MKTFRTWHGLLLAASGFLVILLGLTPTVAPLATTAPAPQPTPIPCITFDAGGPPLNTVFTVGQSYFFPGWPAKLSVWPLQNPASPPANGFVKIAATNLAGGSGHEAQVNNATLRFDMTTTVKSVKLLFGEYGGHLNVAVNGQMTLVKNFADVDGTMLGGVLLKVINGFGNDQGVLYLDGPTNDFAVGGQELWIDDVCAAP
jgi:hypothetical protein